MKTKQMMVGAVLAVSAFASTVALAESPLTANIGINSNYMWRGATQSGDDSAISGGIDYAHESGAYVGTWVSSLGGGNQYEQDLYAGFQFVAGPVDMDAGYILYTYPVGNANLDFSEIYLNAGWEMLNGGIAYTLSKDGTTNDNDLYMYIGAEYELKKGLIVSALYGNYDFDDSATEDYGHFQVMLSKDDFTFALDKNDKSGVGEDDIRFSVGYSKSFDLL